MTFRLPLRDPPEVTQEQHQCWSAAYESWSTACSWIIGGAAAVSEETIEARMAQYPNALNEDGAATMGGVGLLMEIGSMHLDPVAGRDLTTDLLATKLRQLGYIYMPFWAIGRNGPFSHAVVVAHARGGEVRVMDPGRGRGLRTQPTEYYRNAIAMFLGTHILAPTS
ncbi:MAG: hypothetical protein QNJ40_20135 [Xanthomonadales bacterium]|nr:hypothetical protein [Xanthomonadales bacterium]